MQVFWTGAGIYCHVGSYVVICITFPGLWAQATKCLKHHSRIVVDAGCECVPGSMVS